MKTNYLQLPYNFCENVRGWDDVLWNTVASKMAYSHINSEDVFLGAILRHTGWPTGIWLGVKHTASGDCGEENLEAFLCGEPIVMQKALKRRTLVIVNSEFDEEFYLSKYADIREAVKAGAFSSGYAHYVACGKAEGRYGRFKEKSSGLADWIELGGTFYQTFLKRMHSALQPNTYFEIGTLNGDTLRLASCTCISVDPHFQISSEVLGNKPACYFFQVGSDEFFEKHNPIEIFSKAIDIAFLDGMHLFEFLLRDFYNTERYCTRSSIIVLHDCLPGDEYIAVRDPSDSARQKSSRPNYWTGDVWKLVPVLRRWRPDLKIAVLDAPPTGLVLVTNFDSGNRVLRENYTAIMDSYLNLDLGEYGVERLHGESNVISTEDINCAEDFAAHSSIYCGR